MKLKPCSKVIPSKLDPKRKGGSKDVLERFSCILTDCSSLHKVRIEIQSLIAKISDLSVRFQDWRIRALMEQEGSSRSRQEELRTYSGVAYDQEDFVGLEDDIETLSNHLIKDDEECMRSNRVVSICGMGGLGNSTFNKKVDNHPKVKRGFDSFAWVCISQQWKTKNFVQVILVKFVFHRRGKIQMWTIEELITQIFQIQQTQKILMVLDDIWTKIHGNASNMLLLLDINLAKYCSQRDGIIYCSWELLEKKSLRARCHQRCVVNLLNLFILQNLSSNEIIQ